MFTVRSYEPADEVGWVRCRVLSFLGSAFWDAVEREKEHYERPAIELVAEEDGDDRRPPRSRVRDTGARGQARRRRDDLAPRRPSRSPAAGIASALLEEAERRARARGLDRLEAWTRDDAHVQRWYETHGFVLIDGYLHVYLERDDLRQYDG